MKRHGWIGALVAFVATTAAWASACVGLGDLSGRADGADAGDAATVDALDDRAADTASPDARTVADLCVAFARNLCIRLTACAPASVQLQFGGPTNCELRVRESCLSEVTSADVLMTPALGEICADDVGRQTCDEVAAFLRPASCRVPGNRAVGQTCISDYQCQSTLCGTRDAKGCGKCVVPAKLNEACGSGCEQGLSCANSVCVVPLALGDACDASRPCKPTLQCVGSVCVALGTLNQPCSATSACDLGNGFVCVPNSCARLPFASPGEACGTLNNVPTVCTNGMCLANGASSAGGPDASCVAFADPGQACNTSAPPLKPCSIVNMCVAGECVYPSDSLCAP